MVFTKCGALPKLQITVFYCWMGIANFSFVKKKASKKQVRWQFSVISFWVWQKRAKKRKKRNSRFGGSKIDDRWLNLFLIHLFSFCPLSNIPQCVCILQCCTFYQFLVSTILEDFFVFGKQTSLIIPRGTAHSVNKKVITTTTVKSVDKHTHTANKLTLN